MKGTVSETLAGASTDEAAAMLTLLLDLDRPHDSDTVGKQPGGHVLAIGEDACADSGKMTKKEIMHRPFRFDLDNQ